MTITTLAAGGLTVNTALTAGALAPVTISSAAFIGVTVSTAAAGAAGAAVTAFCKVAGTFAVGGGCDCGTIVAATSFIDKPNCETTGCIATGWTCQVAGGTGGQCAAFVVCSRAQ